MGGLILRHREFDWQILALSRIDDPDRAPRFRRAMQTLGARGFMSDLDDSPTLAPLSVDLYEIKSRITSLVTGSFDLIFTHGANGEYTRHPRHEQVHRAVDDMVQSGNLDGDLVSFDYEDNGGLYTPRPSPSAKRLVELTDDELAQKRHIIRDIYGFGEESFEFNSGSRIEAFNDCTEAFGRVFLES